MIQFKNQILHGIDPEQSRRIQDDNSESVNSERADCVQTPFMVSFGSAQDRLAHHERRYISEIEYYPFALSPVEGLRESFHTF